LLLLLFFCFLLLPSFAMTPIQKKNTKKCFTKWLRNTLLVKRILCLVAQSGSASRHAAITL
jgi:hypothetical protein